jgi:hypothetical protein
VAKKIVLKLTLREAQELWGALDYHACGKGNGIIKSRLWAILGDEIVKVGRK